MDDFNMRNTNQASGENNSINPQQDHNTAGSQQQYNNYSQQQGNDNGYIKQDNTNTSQDNPYNRQQNNVYTRQDNMYNQQQNNAYTRQDNMYTPQQDNTNMRQDNMYTPQQDNMNMRQDNTYTPQQNNMYNAQSNNVSQRQDRNVPEYSFWAEQTPNGNSYQGNSSSAGQSSYGYNPENGITDEKKEPKKKHKVFRIIGKAACFGLIAAITIIGVLALYRKINPNASTSSNGYVLGLGNNNSGMLNTELKIKSTEQGTIKVTTNSVVSKVADETMPAIVSIHSVSTQTDSWFGQEYKSEGSGSGIIVEKNDKDNELLIATNNHVVEGTDKITVTFIDGKEMDAVIKGTDVTADLAVISVDLSKMEASTKNQIKVATLGNSDAVKVGEMAIAIGNALDYGQSVTVGYISAKDRSVEVSDNYSYKKMVLLQTDAAINPGNSGGALINVNGEVIGINTIKYADYTVEGMGYAIPISKATPIINELMKREILKDNEKGFLGIGTADVTDEISKMYNIPIGVYVSEVMKEGAAQKAGIQKGDIVTKINDTEITSKIQLKEMISSIKAGTEITVTFMRNDTDGYKEQTLKVVLGTNTSTAQAK